VSFNIGSPSAKTIINHEDRGKAKVKFLREIEAVLQDESIDEDERLISLTVCECMKCHWTFIGDCERQGYGFTSQSQQISNFCPMCGSKFDDDLILEVNHERSDQ